MGSPEVGVSNIGLMDYRWVTPVTDTVVSGTSPHGTRNVPKTTSTLLGNNPRIAEADAGEEDVQEDKKDDEGVVEEREIWQVTDVTEEHLETTEGTGRGLTEISWNCRDDHR